MIDSVRRPLVPPVHPVVRVPRELPPRLPQLYEPPARKADPSGYKRIDIKV